VCIHNFHTRFVNSLYFAVLNLYEPAQGGLHPDFFLTLTSKTSSGAHRYCDTWRCTTFEGNLQILHFNRIAKWAVSLSWTRRTTVISHT
jgi:hypothetical protein